MNAHMKNFIAGGVAAGMAFGAVYAAFAFTEPTGTPPLNNAPAPITAGAGRQVKTGDLTVNNLKASSITLGEETRASWLDAGASCAWTGWKCDCRQDDSTFASVALTVGMQCLGGQLADVKILSLQISSRDKSCGAKAPAPCEAALYSRNGLNSVLTTGSTVEPLGKRGQATPTPVTIPAGKTGQAVP